jgi:two-component system, OmpR family, phosphate regulon sensor histidine kinase PhoR
LSLSDETEVRMSERMRADFLANASHELRTPLAAIIGFIETLRGPARDDEVARARFLEVMANQAERMSRLIADLLSLSRIELNEHVPPTGRSDMAIVVQEAVNGLQPAQQKRIQLAIAQHPIWVQGDGDEITQVVTNLLDNALKYSEPEQSILVSLQGGLGRDDAQIFCMRRWDEAARLSLSTPELRRDQSYGVMRVENGGAGIERQFLPRLSERFFRVEDSASGTSGTGLGLAIVKHIISRHRGGLTVESELGRGTAFGVYFPMAESEASLP